MKKSTVITILVLACGLALCGCKKEQKDLYTLSNGAGMTVTVTPIGARITSVLVPDRDGNLKDVVLGFDDPKSYLPENNQSDFGAAIGRYANRIKDGRINIDGTDYQLPRNNFGHCLHGGTRGWQYQFYNLVEKSGNSLKLERISADGDQNFPGNVRACVTFTVTDDNALDIRYEATTDAPTFINMTNHSYFNLSGEPDKYSVAADELFINASAYTPVDSTFMTTGEILPVEGTPMDFRVAKPVGQDIDADFEQLHFARGYDHNWVLDTDGDDTVPAAELFCPTSGIVMKVYTDEPGIQIYSGNFLDGTVTGKGGIVYNFRHAICLETQKFPDSPNKPEWPSALVKPGETYTSHCVFAFGTK